jgi:multimeric flavodoxin WrbA
MEVNMKVLGVVGSKRKNGNTAQLVEKALEGSRAQSLETECIYLSDYQYMGCNGCEGCRDTYTCIVQDGMQAIYPKLLEADALILGSPTYFYNISADIKALIERMYCYEIFDESDRSVWTSMNEVLGGKSAVTIAICEQEDEHDMGVTSDVMNLSLQSLGYRIVDSVKALRLYSKEDMKENMSYMDAAYKSGVKLGKVLKLKAAVGHKIKL